jgi:POT family proton-dependent oligopeptide transporter
MPPQIPFIIGNEMCERFSFYGMRVNLVAFLVATLLVGQFPDDAERKSQATATFHLFMSGVYFFPLLGGILADRFLGKYRTILYLNLVYCAGHALLALFEDDKTGFMAGLFLIALGSGGIKPCVSAMVGDQFTAESKHLASKVFAAFYWSINLGSFLASALMPWTLKRFGPSVAFGIPGVLMFAATLIFWAGGRHYVKIPPRGRDPHSFFRVLWTGLGDWRRGAGFLGRAEGVHPPEAVVGTRAVLRLLKVFLLVPFFWMLFDQKASTWVLQAQNMDNVVLGFAVLPAQMQMLNPLLVMGLLPLMIGVVYPALERRGVKVTALRKMGAGMVLGAAAYVVAGFVNVPVEAGEKLSILWQLPPYVLLTTAEVLVSVTGLEFAYSQAPRAMKSTIMSLWNLNVTLANVVVALVAVVNVFSGSALFFYYAVFAAVAGLGLFWLSRSYVVVDQYQDRAA